MMEGMDISVLCQGLENTYCKGLYPQETAYF